MRIPFCTPDATPDSLTAVMCVDEELCERNRIFARAPFLFEFPAGAGIDGVEANIVVVSRIKPGVRYRIAMRVATVPRNATHVEIPGADDSMYFAHVDSIAVRT